MAKLDWNKLPENLRYLASPAERYGHFQFDDPILDFLNYDITESEKAELKRLNDQMHLDSDQIEKWLDDFNMTKHDEARLVYFLIHLMCMGFDNKFLNAASPASQ